MSSAQEAQDRKKREIERLARGLEKAQGLGRLEPQLEASELEKGTMDPRPEEIPSSRRRRGERAPGNQEKQQELHARIENDFRYHTPTREKTEGFEEMRMRARHLAHSLVEIVPPGRELSTALTKLEEVIFHANAGLARHG